MLLNFFDILQLDCDWLDDISDTWQEHASYLIANEFVNTVKGVNDPAKRDVKLAQDYAAIFTNDDSVRTLIFQGVEKTSNSSQISRRRL